MKKAFTFILHCFTSGREEQPILKTFCEEVYYYQRRTGHKGFSHQLPYIVCSRSNPELLERLLQDEYPILLEGVHCTYLLQDDRFAREKYYSACTMWNRCITNNLPNAALPG